MRLKPSILKELSESHGIVGGAVPGSRGHYTDATDELVLEDEVQRVSLAGDIDVGSSISGTVIAVYGQEPENMAGKFVVKGVAFPLMPAEVPRSIPESDR